MAEKRVMAISSPLYQLALEYFDDSQIQVTALKGDGSDRKIYRITSGKNRIIGVVHQDIQENRDFLFITERMQKLQLPVAEILSVSDDYATYLLEDLGEKNLAEWIDAWNQNGQVDKIIPAYQKVLAFMPKIQKELPPSVSKYLAHREMGRETYLGDLAYFRGDFLKRFGFEEKYTAAVQEELDGKLVGQLSDLERHYFVYRDFQSRNVMWRNDAPAFIDYQSAFLGPLYYDISSLLYSSRSGLAQASREYLLADYYAKMALTIDYAAFLKNFYGFVLLRRLRSLGSYGFLSMAKNKPHFLDSIEPTLEELKQLLEHQQALHSYPNTAGMVREVLVGWQDLRKGI